MHAKNGPVHETLITPDLNPKVSISGANNELRIFRYPGVFACNLPSDCSIPGCLLPSQEEYLPVPDSPDVL